MKTVVCDLDGTLFNIDHRLHFLKNKDWDGFFGAVRGDTPNEWCVKLLDGLIMVGVEVIFVSGRNEQARLATEEWLYELGFGDCKLYMRPAGDFRPDYEIKRMYFEKRLCDRDILFVIEDRTQVVQMWRSLGLTVLQCNEGSY